MNKLKSNINKSIPFAILFCAIAITIILFNAFKYFEPKNQIEDISVNQNWSMLDKDGNILLDEITLSYEVNNKLPQELIFQKQLESNYFETNIMELLVYQMSFTVYLDDEMIYQHLFDGNTLNPDNPGSGYYTFTLPKDIIGKTLTIEYFRDNPNISVFVQPPLIINAMTFTKTLNPYEIVTLTVMNGFILLGFLMFILYFALKKAFRSSSYLALGLFFMAVGFYILNYDKIFEIYFINPVLSHDIEYLSFYVIPVTVWAYIYYSWERDSNLVYGFMIANGLLYCIFLFLKVAFQIDYSSLLRVFHVAILINIIFYLYVLIKGFFKTSNSYKIFITGAFICVLTPLQPLIQQYFRIFDAFVYYLFIIQIMIGGMLIAVSIILQLIDSIKKLYVSSNTKNQKAEMQRTEKILSSSGILLINYNFINNQTFFSDGCSDYFGIELSQANFPQNFTPLNLHSIDDISFECALDLMMYGNDQLQLTLSFEAFGQTKYCTMDFSSQYDIEDVKTNIIILVKDITKTKQLESQPNIQNETAYSNLKLYDVIIEANIESNSINLIKANNNLLRENLEHQFTYQQLINYMQTKLVKESYRNEFHNNLSREYILSTFEKGVKRYEFETCQLEQNQFQWYNILITIHQSPVNQHIKALIYVKNITNYRNSSIILDKQAQTDLLTGLYNKDAFARLVINGLNNTSTKIHHALLIIEVNNFETYSQQYGQTFADALIRDVGYRLVKQFDIKDIIGRIGSNQFAIYLHNAPSNDKLPLVGKQLINQLAYKFTYLDISVEISFSIGISSYPIDGDNFEELFNKANSALLAAKNSGHHTYDQ